MTSHEDDEYRWAGVEDPKIVITTSRDPSSRLKMFAKVRLLFANHLFATGFGHRRSRSPVTGSIGGVITDADDR